MTARTEAADLARIILADSEGDLPNDLYPLNVREARTLARAARAALAVATPADPHHDPRPWQDCTRKDIREGDLMEAQVSDLLRGGVAHHQDAAGDWWTEGGYRLTGGARRPLRRIPAPTPPAEEVDLPGVPCVLTDVQLREALAAGVALWTGLEVVVAGFDGRAVTHPAQDLTAFTLPDGTRARRDGDHADGTPRFVKVEADQ